MRRLLLLLALVFFLPGSGLAQPADTSFRAFYASLPALNDADLKAAVEKMEPVHAAFASLELHKRTNNGAHASRAVRLLGAELRKNESQPWVHFGVAIGLQRTPKSINILRSYGVQREGMGSEVVKVAIHQHLQLALKYDPGLEEARSMLAQLEGDPYVRVADIAEFKSAADYFRALDHADDAAFANLVRDIALIATSQEVLTVEQGDLAKRKDALRLFWKKRGVRDGIAEETRILEHYRRIDFARSNYGRPVPYYTIYGKRRTGLETEMDDRGLIYVRFGPPHNYDLVANEVSEGGKQRAGAEIWAYRQPDGRNHVYFFSGGRLIADPLGAIMGGPNATLNDNIDRDKAMTALQKYDARYHFIAMRQENVRLHGFMARMDPTYAAIAASRSADAAEDADRQRTRIAEKNRRMLFAAFEMDAARPRFPNMLTFFHDFATFRGTGRCTDVVYSVAARSPSYKLTLAVADTFTWDAQSIDTTVTAGAGDGEYVRATGVFCMTPDYNAYVRLSASADSMTGTTAGGDLSIPNYAEAGLQISSILFAKTADGPFVRGNARLELVPPNQFREDEAFRIFYELYNLPAGRPYRTEITLTSDGNFVSRLFKGKSSTRVTFEGVAEGRDVVQELRTIIPQIEAGEAEVTVKVTDLVTNQTTTTKKSIWIIPAEAPVKN